MLRGSGAAFNGFRVATRHNLECLLDTWKREIDASVVFAADLTVQAFILTRDSFVPFVGGAACTVARVRSEQLEEILALYRRFEVEAHHGVVDDSEAAAARLRRRVAENIEQGKLME